MSDIEKDIAEYRKKKRNEYFRTWRDNNRESYRRYQREYKRKLREAQRLKGRD